MRIATGILLASALAASACKSEIDDKPAAQVKDPASAENDAAKEQGADASTQTSLAIDPQQSRIGFVGAKVTDDHEGSFSTFRGTARMTGDELAALELVVEIDSMKVEPEKLRGHLLSSDFFDAEKIPQAKFVSTAIRQKAQGEATHEIEGDLTLHGVTKTITFPAHIEIGDDQAKGHAEFKINRKDFDINYPGMPDDLIKDDVLLKLDLVVPRRDSAS